LLRSSHCVRDSVTVVPNLPFGKLAYQQELLASNIFNGAILSLSVHLSVQTNATNCFLQTPL